MYLLYTLQVIQSQKRLNVFTFNPRMIYYKIDHKIIIVKQTYLEMHF